MSDVGQGQGQDRCHLREVAEVITEGGHGEIVNCELVHFIAKVVMVR